MAKGGKRDGAGRPKGVPNKATAEIREIAQKYSPQAVKELAKLAGLIDGQKAAESEQARIAALNGILDRGHGKPAQAVALTGEDGEGPAKIEYSWAASKGS